MRRFGRAVLAAALTFAIGACHPFGDRRPVVRQGPIFSPNGEPLSGGPLGDPSCKDAMQKWLARVDANHDGTIEVSEFMADARRQFSAMDLDKSGVLTPDILARYRAPYASARGDEFASDGEERRHRRDDDRDEDDDDRRAPRVEDGVDPVMIADVSLQNRVTLDEFLTYERSNFAAIDAAHAGRIDLDELVATCEPAR